MLAPRASTIRTGSRTGKNIPQDAQKDRSAKAAVNEEPRRYKPHFVWAVRLCNALGERKNPFGHTVLRASPSQGEGSERCENVASGLFLHPA